MKILVLYRNNRKNYNHFCNFDYYQILSQLPGVTLKFYGPAIEHMIGVPVVCNFNEEITMQNLLAKFSFDVILIGGKNRMYYDATEATSWLPSDFAYFECTKVLVEPDYHKYRNSTWFDENNIDIILHRHQANIIRAIEDFPGKKHIWFPFSVDMNVFKPMNKKRTNRVCFVGSQRASAYYFRKIAAEKLAEKGLLAFNGQRFEHEYIDILNDYTVYLNGASKFNIDCAKAFEIIASGGILLTNDANNGFKTLFGNSFVTYKNDFSDLIDNTKRLLDDTDLQKKLVEKGIKVIKRKHTHEKRCKELMEILDEVVVPQTMDIVYCIGNLDKKAWKRFMISYQSLHLNENYRIKVSEVGEESSYEQLKVFINDFDYHFHKSAEFQASTAKNNAYKYLIKNTVFSFMDIDMIVPRDFVTRAIRFCKQNNKAFICSYARLEKNHLTEYDKIRANGLEVISKSGILVCTRSIYDMLNGFDEDYVGWGGRDSDFYSRAEAMGVFLLNTDILLYHQYHPRQFGKHREENRNRYQERLKEYSTNKNAITNINGLRSKTEQVACIPKEIEAINDLRMLVESNIKVCLLKRTCYQRTTEKPMTYPLCIGVEKKDFNRTMEMLGDKLDLYIMPSKTKKCAIDNFTVQIPAPVTRYLRMLKYDV